MEEERYCMIPRNLNEPDKPFQIAGKGLSWKQIGYIAVGGAAAYGIFHIAILPLTVKLVASVFSTGVSTILATSRIKGQETEEIVGNMIVYGQHKIYYHNVERALQNGENQHRPEGPTVRISSFCPTEVSQGTKNIRL